jgi:hypothetical protein
MKTQILQLCPILDPPLYRPMLQFGRQTRTCKHLFREYVKIQDGVHT